MFYDRHISPSKRWRYQCGGYSETACKIRSFSGGLKISWIRICHRKQWPTVQVLVGHFTPYKPFSRFTYRSPTLSPSSLPHHLTYDFHNYFPPPLSLVPDFRLILLFLFHLTAYAMLATYSPDQGPSSASLFLVPFLSR